MSGTPKVHVPLRHYDILRVFAEMTKAVFKRRHLEMEGLELSGRALTRHAVPDLGCILSKAVWRHGRIK